MKNMPLMDKTTASPRVSIILCFYNEERYLKLSIDSILAQTYKDFELIIVNDGSSDGSEKIVKSYNDPRIVYHTYEKNRRLAYARNRGLELARGEYVGFFDADDIMEKDKTEKQVRFLDEHSEITVVGGAFSYMDAEGNTDTDVTLPMYTEDLDIRAHMLFGNCMWVGSALFRKGILDKHGITLDESNKASEDYRLWTDMMPYARFAYINDRVYYYRVNHGSKATLIVNKDTSAYDREISGILKAAWSGRGFKLGENDIEFIRKYLFENKRTLSPSSLHQKNVTLRKIKKQLSELELPEGELILKEYKKAWACAFHTYWILKKLTGKKENGRI